jgi:CRISPR-associated protein Cas1
MIIKQVLTHCDNEKRLYLAKRIIETAAYNILSNLRYYHSRGSNLREGISIIGELSESLNDAKDISQLMGIEGNIRYFYYACWEDIIHVPVKFEKRVKNPPSDIVNSLISFGNMMMYSTCLTEIYRSGLHPGLGFLHQSGDKKNSLSFDIAEIFKPVVVDRVIFKLLNRRIIGYQDFITKGDFCMMKEAARKTFVQEFDKKLSTTLHADDLSRQISYRSLIRKECYKIINFIEKGEEYSGFRYSNY